MTATIIIGYGNIDRQDDGAAWHIINGVAEKLGIPLPKFWDEDFQPFGSSDKITLKRLFQLTPELSEEVSTYDQAIFIDAHTGDRLDEFTIEPVSAVYQASPMTHHMTPATVLALAKTLYGKAPEAVMVSVQGYDFGFGNALSNQTAKLASQAVDEIIQQISRSGKQGKE